MCEAHEPRGRATALLAAGRKTNPGRMYPTSAKVLARWASFAPPRQAPALPHRLLLTITTGGSISTCGNDRNRYSAVCRTNNSSLWKH